MLVTVIVTVETVCRVLLSVHKLYFSTRIYNPVFILTLYIRFNIVYFRIFVNMQLFPNAQLFEHFRIYVLFDFINLTQVHNLTVSAQDILPSVDFRYLP